ncbi:hypothetical protein G6F40_016421 [Rhizopus arrhizus]|nr:hypothetical protein G6F40_016421 [Rhizopus arrhizus]
MRAGQCLIVRVHAHRTAKSIQKRGGRETPLMTIRNRKPLIALIVAAGSVLAIPAMAQSAKQQAAQAQNEAAQAQQAAAQAGQAADQATNAAAAASAQANGGERRPRPGVRPGRYQQGRRAECR